MATSVAAAAESQYFYEDVVYRVDKRGNVEFGFVMENDDQDMSDESSDSEEGPKRKKGEIRVIWHPSGVEEFVVSKKVCFQLLRGLLVDNSSVLRPPAIVWSPINMHFFFFFSELT